MKVHPKNPLMPELKYEHSLRMMSSQHWKLNLISHDCSTQFLLIEFSFKCHPVSHLSSSLLPPPPLLPKKKKKKPKQWWLREASVYCRAGWRCRGLLRVGTNQCIDGLIKTWNNHPKCVYYGSGCSFDFAQRAFIVSQIEGYKIAPKAVQYICGLFIHNRG